MDFAKLAALYNDVKNIPENRAYTAGEMEKMCAGCDGLVIDLPVKSSDIARFVALGCRAFVSPSG